MFKGRMATFDKTASPQLPQ